MTRSDVKPIGAWASIRSGISKEEFLQLQPAVDFLDLFLLLEPTNSAVERDAATARVIKEVTRNKAGADTMDNRMRVKTEGPHWRKVIGHPLVEQTAKDFLMHKPRRNTPGTRHVKPPSEQHKASLSTAAKRLKCGM
eukprot:7494666-Karenia_brevis.AAC.1